MVDGGGGGGGGGGGSYCSSANCAVGGPFIVIWRYMRSCQQALGSGSTIAGGGAGGAGGAAVPLLTVQSR